MCTKNTRKIGTKYQCALALLALGLSASSSNFVMASSEVAVCPPNLIAETVQNLVVEENSYCYLENVEVNGDIKVKRGGILVGSEIVVHGSVFANSADTVFIGASDPDHPSVIEGNVTLIKLDSAQIVLTLVGGNLMLAQNVFGLANSSDILGNLNFVGNEGAQLNNNWVGKNLICKNNDSFTTVSGKNDVEGNVSNECEGFILP